ncbi:MAG: UDP-glucose/GDP-mannose dehydrogenase family protein [Chloroflexi bacterium]|nr:UDP-glucose/GDP-mannose dehydrogenase family protein [Chloroflexota bacterium]
MTRRLSVIGLGKLGVPMAVLFAHKGFSVIGVDVHSALIESLNRKQCPIYEPGVPELLESLRGTLTATDDYKYAIQNSEVSFIVVPTPSEENGGFATKYVEAAAERIAGNLKHKDDFHLIVLTSTVLPGATASLKDLLERISGKECGVDFGLCYSPEFIALGSVLQGLTNPDLVLIGESDPKSGEMLSQVYRHVCQNTPPIVRTNFCNAELAKILLNAYVTMKISFANIMAEMCEKIPGGDVNAVSHILGLDSRIGRKYLSGGLGFGGPCFPRDNRAVACSAQSLGMADRLARATDEVNRDQNARIVGVIKEKLGRLKGSAIAILGLTYKAQTDVVEESAAVEIAKILLGEGCRVSVYDPAGMDNARSTLGDGVKYASSAEECLRDTEFCLLATPWEEFKTLRAEAFTKNMKRPALLDCWRIFDRSEFSERLEYLAIGLSSSHNSR